MKKTYEVAKGNYWQNYIGETGEWVEISILKYLWLYICGYKVRKYMKSCRSCKFNCEDDHTCMNDCNVGSYYADKGLNKICYNGEEYIYDTRQK